MAVDTTDQQHQHQETSPTTRTSETTKSTCSLFFKRLMSQGITWVFVLILLYTILLSSSWNILRSILSWYKSNPDTSPSSFTGWPPALYASVAMGAVFGLLSMAAVVAVAVPATLVAWITVMVFLAFCGKTRGALVVEGRKLTAEISGFVVKILIREGNAVAAICAVLGYFALVRWSRTESFFVGFS